MEVHQEIFTCKTSLTKSVLTLHIMTAKTIMCC